MRRSRPRKNKPTRRDPQGGSTAGGGAGRTTDGVDTADIDTAGVGTGDVDAGGVGAVGSEVGDRGSDQEGSIMTREQDTENEPTALGASAQTAPETAADEAGPPPPVERVIERFGGIRPMAAKLDVPVTTVQGWKKRGVIPPPRHDDLRAAAERHEIAIDEEELTLAGQHDAAAPPAEDAPSAEPPSTETPASETPASETSSGGATPADPPSKEDASAAAGASGSTKPTKPAAAPLAAPAAAPVTVGPANVELMGLESAKIEPDDFTTDAFPSDGRDYDDEPVRIVNGAARSASPGWDGETVAEPARSDRGGGSGFATVASLIALAVGVAALSQPYWGGGGSPAPAAPAAPASVGQTGRPMAPPVDELARAEVKALAEKVDALSASVARGGGSAPAAGGSADARVGDLAAGLDALKGDVARLGETVAAVGAVMATRSEAAPANAPDPAVTDALATLTERLGALETAVEAMGARVDAQAAAAAAPPDPAPEVGLTPALALAVGELRAALAEGGAFADELGKVRAIAGDAPGITGPLDALTPFAATGAPTVATLAGRLSDLEGGLARADQRGGGGDWIAEVRGALATLVTVRPRGGDATGDGAAAVAERARAAVAAGRLADGVTELETLTGPAAQVAAPWLADARARLAVDGAGHAMAAWAAAALAGAGTDAGNDGTAGAKAANDGTEGAR